MSTCCLKTARVDRMRNLEGCGKITVAASNRHSHDRRRPPWVALATINTNTVVHFDSGI